MPRYAGSVVEFHNTFLVDVDHPSVSQQLHDLVNALLDRQFAGGQAKVGIAGGLVRRRQAGNIIRLGPLLICVAAARIASLADIERSVQVNDEETIEADDLGRLSDALPPRGRRSAAMQIKPASLISLATSAPRRRFSERSSALNPRSRLTPNRRFWPSSTMAACPASNRRRSRA